MLFRWLRGDTGAVDTPKAASEELTELVRSSMPEASAEAAAVVGAVAGLLAFVAYADRDYHAQEQRAVSEALGRIDGLPAHAGEAIAALLAARIDELALEPLQTYTRVLYEHASRDARIEVLDVLMDVAAADHVLSMDETNDLRRVARQLGLSDRDYDAAQIRHRDRLSVLR